MSWCSSVHVLYLKKTQQNKTNENKQNTSTFKMLLISVTRGNITWDSNANACLTSSLHPSLWWMIRQEFLVDNIPSPELTNRTLAAMTQALKKQPLLDRPERSLCYRNTNLRAISTKLKLRSRLLHDQVCSEPIAFYLKALRENSEVRLSCAFPQT